MVANVIPFCFESQSVRVVEKNGDPWFVAKDVCDVLGYQNPSKTLSDHLDDDERSNVSLGRQGKANVISESGLYTLIIRSNKPQAKPFRRWVTKEVLPQIRRTGSYSIPTPGHDLVTIIRGAVKKEFAAVEQAKRRKIEPWLLDMLEQTPREKMEFIYVALPMAYAGVSFSWWIRQGTTMAS